MPYTADALTQARNLQRCSLVIVDELGRGTSTHDGLAIALATLEHLVLVRTIPLRCPSPKHRPLSLTLSLTNCHRTHALRRGAELFRASWTFLRGHRSGSPI